MAIPTVLIDTTFTGVDVSAGASVYEYTATANVTVRVQVRMAAVAGGGDYIVWITLNDGDAQTDDKVHPRTTITLAASETTMWFMSGNIDLISGDVINVFVDGLAGDTSEAGTVRIFTDAPLQPTVLGRTLDVTATGAAGVDWANVEGPTSTVGLTNTTISASSAPSASDIWAYATRTLTQSAAAVTAAVSGSTLTIHRGDTWSATLTGLSANTGYVSIDLTVKRDKDDADTAAIIKIRKNASGTGDGLLYLNGAAGTAAQGTITVNSATSLTLALSALSSDDLVPEEGLYYDIQYILAASVTTATYGTCNITADVTRAVV